MFLNKDKTTELFETLLRDLRAEMAKNPMTNTDVAEITGYAPSTVNNLLANRSTGMTRSSAAKGSSRFTTIVDFYKAFKLNMKVKSFRHEFEMTEDGRDQLMKAVYDYISDSPASYQSLAKSAGVSAVLLKNIIDDAGKYTDKVSTLAYIHVYHELISQVQFKTSIPE